MIRENVRLPVTKERQTRRVRIGAAPILDWMARAGLALFLIWVALFLIGLLSFAMSSPRIAHLGSVGPSFEIAEPDLLANLEARFAAIEADGGVEALREEMRDRARAYVAAPPPVPGMGGVEEDSVRLFDPSITLTRDLRDHEGRVFAPAGTTVNPLHHVPFRRRLILIDGRDEAQVAFAMAEGDELTTRIILTAGAPIALNKRHGRRFYFDQQGRIVRRFGLSRLPSIVEAAPDEPDLLQIREVVVK